MSFEILEIKVNTPYPCRLRAVFGGHGVRPEQLELHWEQPQHLSALQAMAEVVCYFTVTVPSAEVLLMEELVKGVDPSVLSEALRGALQEWGVPNEVEVTSPVSLAMPAPTTTSSSVAPCGEGHRVSPATIEGGFELSGSAFKSPRPLRPEATTSRASKNTSWSGCRCWGRAP